MDKPVSGRLLAHGIRTSIFNNAMAYGFSIMITVVLAATQRLLGSPSIVELFVYVLGATTAFVIVESVATRGFRERIRPERTDVVALGAAFAIVSVTASLAVAVGVAHALTGLAGWFVTPFAATTTYIVASGFEMALGRRGQEDRDTETEDEPDRTDG